MLDNLPPSALRVLMVVPYVPSRIRVRSYNILRGLAQRGHAITLLCPCSSAAEQQDLDALRPLCERVITLPQRHGEMLTSVGRAFRGGLPLQAGVNATPALQKLVRYTVEADFFDVIHVEHLRGAELAVAALANGHSSGPPVIFDAVDSISLLFERALRGSPSTKTRCMALLDLARTRRYESSYGQHFATTLVTSPEDRWALETLRQQWALPASGDIDVLPNGVDLEYFAPQELRRDPATIVLTGKMSYHANHAAALFLIHEIMPLVWRTQPDVRVQIVGGGPSRDLRALAHDQRVCVTGYVPDLRPYLARATLAICPLRYGVGIQNKVLEALAMATPVIASRQATVALGAQPGRDLLLAEQPDAFARHTLELLNDMTRRHTIGMNGRQYVEQWHDWNGIAARLEHCYTNALQVRG